MAYRKFIYNNDEYYFNFSSFKQYFSKKRKEDHVKVGDLEYLLASNINITKEAVHNWRMSSNGPSDIQLVTQIAKFFNISDVTLLLTKEKEVNTNMLTDLQLQSFKKVYDSILDFLDEFNESDGFNDLWFEVEGDPNDKKGLIWDVVNKKHEGVMKTLNKEYFYLKNTALYEELENYIYNDMYDIYETKKLDYAYRFEALGTDQPTTQDDYTKALNKINEIVNKYYK
ncbi:MAG: hypothetical protein K6E99_02940 [Bacilli bacterium]|nr:hypothetical protein [Bacilli bacterium]